MKTFFLLSLIFSFALTLPATAAVLTNICDVAGVLVDERHAVGDRFDLCGQVMRINDGPYRSIILGDGGAMFLAISSMRPDKRPKTTAT